MWNMANLSIKKRDARQARFRRLLDASGENTLAGAIDVAVQYYLADVRNKRSVAEELPPDFARKLSTTYVPISVDIEVGRST